MPYLCSQDPGWLSNAWLVWDGEGGHAVLVDTGAPLARLFAAIATHRLHLDAVLTTHRHGDHVAGHAEAARGGAVILAHPIEVPHVPGAVAADPESERSFGPLCVRLMPLPGHTAGHAGWWIEDIGLFTGDALFQGSVGGTLGTGAAGFAQQRASLAAIFALAPNTALHPGHGPSTTVAQERESNPLARAILGLAPSEPRPGSALSRPAQVLCLAPDYDGGTKAWVRFEDDGTDAIVPGSRVEILGVKSRRTLLVLLAAGAALHGAYLFALRAHDPLWDLLVHDAHRYHAWASAWATGERFESGAFSQAPLYPALVAAVFAVAGTRLTTVFVLQLALAMGALALVHTAARRAYGAAAAATAVALGVLTHPLAFYEARLLPTVLAVFLAALAVERLQAAQAAGNLRAWLLAGGAVGLAGVARPDLLLLAPAALVLPEARRLRTGAALAAGVLLCVAPVAARNLLASGELVLVSTQGGITFWQGNNPAARGGYSTPEGFTGSIATQRQEARILAAPALGPAAGDAEVSRYWLRRGLASLAEDPVRAVRLIARKAALALDAREHGLEYAPHLDRSPLRPLLPVSFGVLFALAAVRLVRSPADRSPERPLLLLLAVEAVVLLAFYAAGRYRMTALPALLAVAGFGAISLARALRARTAAAPLGALAASALLAYVPLPGRGAAVLALEDAGALRDRGEAFLTRGDLARARQALQRAVALNPSDPTLPLDLGKVEARAGDPARAAEHFRQALAMTPDLAEAHLDLGVLLYTGGHLEAAAASFATAHRLDPADAAAANNLLGTLRRLGRLGEARALAADMDARGVPVDAALR